MSTLLIKNGNIVTATDHFTGDIFIKDEKIHAILSSDLSSELKFDDQKKIEEKVDKVIDAKWNYVFPGGVDPHTHMDLPFMGTSSCDDFESGTIAALQGGTTSIIDFAIQSQGESLNSALNKWMEKAKGKAAADYGFHLAVTDFNERTCGEIQNLIRTQGVSSFKTYMAYKGALMVDDRQMIELLNEVKLWGGIVTTHAENGDLIDSLVAKARENKQTTPLYHALTRPDIAEEEATGRFLDLTFSGNHPAYIVHMSAKSALDRVRQATLRNQKVFVETCLQYLLLDASLYDSPDFEGAKWVMSPPLRSKKDQLALWNGINQNLVQVVATDHCPFRMNQKKMGENDFSKIPNGAPGIENRMELLFSEGVITNRISLNKFVDITSTQAAKIFGLFPQKGNISVGADADLVILDPNQRHTISSKTHHTNCDYSAFEGWQVQGKCHTTILRGQVAVQNGKFMLPKGYGKYLPRKRLYHMPTITE